MAIYYCIWGDTVEVVRNNNNVKIELTHQTVGLHKASEDDFKMRTVMLLVFVTLERQVS